jgi:hypothetical protein
VVSLENRVLTERTDRLTAAANAVTALAALDLQPLLDKERVVLVTLTLSDSSGVVSTNTYWQARDDASHQRLNDLPQQELALRSRVSTTAGERILTVDLANTGRVPALAAKLTLLDDKGNRILPALYSDNYITLLPGEHRQVEIRFAPAFSGIPRLALRGWNVAPATASISR